MKRYIILSIFVVGFISFSLAQTSMSGDAVETQIPDDRGYVVSVGQMTPEFEIELTDGTIVHSDDLRGKVVMLQFTASWCSVCRKEMPHIEEEVWLPNQDKPFVLIGVDRDEPLETVIKFARDMQISYPLGLDPGADIFGLFADKKSGVTRNIIIDQNGKIAFLTRLFEKEEFEAMKRKIAELLGA